MRCVYAACLCLLLLYTAFLRGQLGQVCSYFDRCLACCLETEKEHKKKKKKKKKKKEKKKKKKKKEKEKKKKKKHTKKKNRQCTRNITSKKT